MMLRKRTRSQQKAQAMGNESGSDSQLQSDANGRSKKGNSFFGVPGLFVGFTPKVLSDCDSVRSPTSPLDVRMFSYLGNSNPSRSPTRSVGNRKWNCDKVGLSIIDTLDNDVKQTGKVLGSSESKNILFGPQMRIKTPNCQMHASCLEAPKSLPSEIYPRGQIKSPLNKGSSGVIFEIGESALVPDLFGKTRASSLGSYGSFSAHSSGSADHGSFSNSENFCLVNATMEMDSPSLLIGGNPDANNNFSHSKLSVGSGNGSTETISASEIELSEDYTCVISHGPNPTTTHIFGDCILESHSTLSNCDKNERKVFELAPAVTSTETLRSSGDFLSYCYSCNKKLEGKDIYIYRGEKSFCSLNCRSEEILIDEEMEKSTNKTASDEGEEPESGISVKA